MSTPWDDDKDDKGNRAAGLLPLGVVLVISGGVMLGVGGSSVFPEMEALSALSDGWKAGGSSAMPLGVTALVAAVACGGGVVFSGLLAIGAHVLKSRPLAVFVLILTVAVSAVQLAAGVLYPQVVDTAFSVLEPHGRDANFDADQLALVNLAMVVHKRCCFDKYFNDTAIDALIRNDFQPPANECPDAPSAQSCENTLPEVLLLIPNLDTSLLCTCYESEVYSPIDNYVDKSGICEKLTNTYVPVGKELEIPVAGITLDTALGFTPYKVNLPIAEFAMTGFPAPKDADGNEGFNCGLVYVKGVAWIQYLFLEQVGATVSILCYALGGIQILGAILVLAFWGIGGGTAQDDFMDYEGSAIAPKSKF